MTAVGTLHCACMSVWEFANFLASLPAVIGTQRGIATLCKHRTPRPAPHSHPASPRKACYATVDFPALLRGELLPPRVPTVRGPLDVSNFDDYEMDDKYLKGARTGAALRIGTTRLRVRVHVISPRPG